MRSMLSAVWCVLLLLTEVRAIGQFTQPTGSDGADTFSLGGKVDIAWTGTSSYTTFSLGVFSSTNATISWFISNSHSLPTSYEWTVDVKALGFDLTSSHLFQLYACNGSYFDGNAFSLAFTSPWFNIEPAAASSSSSSSSSLLSSTSASTSTSSKSPTAIISATSATVTASSTTLATVVSPSSTGTASPASSSASADSSGSLSAGAKAGIAIAAVLGALAILGAGIWYGMRRKPRTQKSPNNPRELPGNGVSPAYKSPKEYEYYSSNAGKYPPQPSQIHEVPAEHVSRAQLPSQEKFRSPVELAGSVPGRN